MIRIVSYFWVIPNEKSTAEQSFPLGCGYWTWSDAGKFMLKGGSNGNPSYPPSKRGSDKT